MAAHQEITVTSGVRPAAIVRYDHDIEAVRETLDILSDPATLEASNRAATRSLAEIS